MGYGYNIPFGIRVWIVGAVVIGWIVMYIIDRYLGGEVR
jgi:F0F1-type ATP synthase assembly protein I